MLTVRVRTMLMTAAGGRTLHGLAPLPSRLTGALTVRRLGFVVLAGKRPPHLWRPSEPPRAGRACAVDSGTARRRQRASSVRITAVAIKLSRIVFSLAAFQFFSFTFRVILN